MNLDSPDEAPEGLVRRLLPGQTSQIWVAGIDGSRKLVHETDQVLLEAPNWTPDGWLLLNGGGRLWHLPVDGSGDLTRLPVSDLPLVSNDHVVSPDGKLIYITCADGRIHVLPRNGGQARRVTADDGRMHFLHGISPDGTQLAYVALLIDEDWQVLAANVRVVGIDGHNDYPITDFPEPDDGPEYSPDGQWIYFNTERYRTQPGHAQIARARVDGSDLQRVITSDRVDWFPHLSPDGSHATYISFPAGTLGHPPNLPVEIHVVATSDWQHPVRVIELFGGQGSLNVNSWAPDGTRFAYVAYPVPERSSTATSR